MKATDIIARQDRVVYILLVVVGAIGLAWTIWRHQYLAQADNVPAPPVTAQPVGSPRQ